MKERTAGPNGGYQKRSLYNVFLLWQPLKETRSFGLKRTRLWPTRTSRGGSLMSKNSKSSQSRFACTACCSRWRWVAKKWQLKTARLKPSTNWLPASDVCARVSSRASSRCRLLFAKGRIVSKRNSSSRLSKTCNARILTQLTGRWRLSN